MRKEPHQINPVDTELDEGGGVVSPILLHEHHSHLRQWLPSPLVPQFLPLLFISLNHKPVSLTVPFPLFPLQPSSTENAPLSPSPLVPLNPLRFPIPTPKIGLFSLLMNHPAASSESATRYYFQFTFNSLTRFLCFLWFLFIGRYSFGKIKHLGILSGKWRMIFNIICFEAIWKFCYGCR